MGDWNLVGWGFGGPPRGGGLGPSVGSVGWVGQENIFGDFFKVKNGFGVEHLCRALVYTRGVLLKGGCSTQ